MGQEGSQRCVRGRRSFFPVARSRRRRIPSSARCPRPGSTLPARSLIVCSSASPYPRSTVRRPAPSDPAPRSSAAPADQREGGGRATCSASRRGRTWCWTRIAAREKGETCSCRGRGRCWRSRRDHVDDRLALRQEQRREGDESPVQRGGCERERERGRDVLASMNCVPISQCAGPETAHVWWQMNEQRSQHDRFLPALM